MATHDGTWSYRGRFGDRFGRTYFRRFGPGVVSSIGAGTYLGDPTDEVDDRYVDALTTALDGGCNLIDTAINYRHQRSERAVGRALDAADAAREEVVIATKGGFVPFDRDRPDDPGRYVREEFLETGLVDRDDLARGSHCIAPAFLSEMLDRSLDNLGVETVDCYYVHNPETQLAVRDRAAVYDALEAAFRELERRRATGDIGGYGVATWEAFRVGADDSAHLSLPEVCARADAAAETAGAAESGLIAIQLPFNVAMADAFTAKVHPHSPEADDPESKSEPTSALEYANDVGLRVVTSASLAQGDLVRQLPEEVAAELEGDTTAQRALNFARSAPGVTCSLVGTTDPAHVAENLAAGTFDPLGAQAFDAVFE